ncbi:ribosomal protein S5 domain 2-type protein [Ampelomyces quisqualis]|uniref:Ribosomal RNA-processing protein 43 n=1 Tax=Ampelomyces quisqualis TaxID=50730 RepID=A0A6A5QMN0_AMPQU|nr:ribosomal protein S5 domain 2-type protein [Ampelomyces quisqualis]
MATTTQKPQNAPSLTFPRPIFAAVSPHPFLQAHLSANKKNPQRANGRLPHDFRKPGIHTGSLTHANGSAVVRLGNTSVVCGVRAEILREEDIPGANGVSPHLSNKAAEEGVEDDDNDSEEIDTLRLIVPNVELSTGSTPSHIPGTAPSPVAQSIITRLRSLLLSTRLLRASDLRILHTPATNAADPACAPETVLKGYWVLYMDVIFISIDGSALDAAWLALLSALRNTILPRACFDEDLERILCDDDPLAARPLSLRGLPVPATFAVLQGQPEESGEEDVRWILSDPDAFEEGVCRECVCVVVDEAGKLIRRVEKHGGGVVGRREMRDMVKRAGERWRDVQVALSGKA